ncbi:hypothetical protein K438DRAFT_1767179 [Mycena galopus ATCC 62051]|nr:hypothetical protein K438DRAFT_1767179 [Mycena galopus ATCC 62051]
MFSVGRGTQYKIIWRDVQFWPDKWSSSCTLADYIDPNLLGRCCAQAIYPKSAPTLGASPSDRRRQFLFFAVFVRLAGTLLGPRYKHILCFKYTALRTNNSWQVKLLLANLGLMRIAINTLHRNDSYRNERSWFLGWKLLPWGFLGGFEAFRIDALVGPQIQRACSWSKICKGGVEHTLRETTHGRNGGDESLHHILTGESPRRWNGRRRWCGNLREIIRAKKTSFSIRKTLGWERPIVGPFNCKFKQKRFLIHPAGRYASDSEEDEIWQRNLPMIASATISRKITHPVRARTVERWCGNLREIIRAKKMSFGLFENSHGRMSAFLGRIRKNVVGRAQHENQCAGASRGNFGVQKFIDAP